MGSNSPDPSVLPPRLYPQDTRFDLFDQSCILQKRHSPYKKFRVNQYTNEPSILKVHRVQYGSIISLNNSNYIGDDGRHMNAASPIIKRLKKVS